MMSKDYSRNQSPVKQTSKLLCATDIEWIQGASRETDLFEINIAPLFFSVEFIYYHEMIRYYMPFCVRFTLLCFRPFLIRQHVTEQNGLDSSRWTLSLFPRSPGFVQLRQDQVVSSSLSLILFEKMWPTSRWYYELECSNDARYWNGNERADEFQ